MFDDDEPPTALEFLVATLAGCALGALFLAGWIAF